MILKPKSRPKPIKRDGKRVSEIMRLDENLTSDEIRTAWYLLTKKSIRKSISEIKKDISKLR